MKQVLNEELFRIQEIMGIKKTIINEDFQTEQKNLISEQSLFADLIQGASLAGKEIEQSALSSVDNIISQETARLKNAMTIPKRYNTLEELSDAIAKKEIDDAVVNVISKPILKGIIQTPEGAKLVAKYWFEENIAEKMKISIRKINNNDFLPPDLIIKTTNDYNQTVALLKTGDSDIDDGLRTGLWDDYGKSLNDARTKALDDIEKAAELDRNYKFIKDGVRKKIKDNPLLSKKKFADWFDHFEEQTKELIKSKGEIKAKKYLFDQLSKPSIWGKIKELFSGEKFFKFIEYYKKNGIMLSVQTAGVIIIGIIVYYAVYFIQQKGDSATKGETQKFKDVFLVTKDASDELINNFLNVFPTTELTSLYMKKEGYKVTYNTSENDVLGTIEVLKVETPSKTYEYTLQKSTGTVDEKITAKDGSVVNIDGNSGQNTSNQGETPATGEFVEWFNNKYEIQITKDNVTINNDNTVKVTVGNQTATYKKVGDKAFQEI